MNNQKESFEQMVERYKKDIMKYKPKPMQEENSIPTVSLQASSDQLKLGSDNGEDQSSPSANTQTGYLKVMVNVGNKAMPIEGASVLVTENDNGKQILRYFGFTDKSGETPVISLPAPPVENSEAPKGKNVYAVYDIRTDAPGYRTVINRGVPIFEGITSVQNVQLNPLPGDPIEYMKNEPDL